MSDERMTPKELQEAIDRFCDLENRVQELERQISTSTEDRTMSDAKEPTGWRDIQSAPKHTAVDLLGYYPGRNPKPRRIPDCKLSSSKRWSTKHRDPSGRSLLRANFTPTHWMPLPPPPGQDTSELEALRADLEMERLRRVVDNAPKTEAATVLRDENAALRDAAKIALKALASHHHASMNIGRVVFPTEPDMPEPVEIDLSEAYAESDVCTQTVLEIDCLRSALSTQESGL